MLTQCEIHEGKTQNISQLSNTEQNRGGKVTGESNLCTVIADVERIWNVNEAADKIE